MLSLHPQAIADLRKSGLSDDTITLMECASIRPCEIKGLKGVIHAYRIPYFTVDGSRTDFERWKLFPPKQTDGGTMKYWQKAGTAPHVYLPPVCEWASVAADPTQTIVIVEGEKKSAAGCQHGRPVMAVGGVWCWRCKDAFGNPRLLPEFDAVIWRGRTVNLCPDSDAYWPGKEEVLLGIYALGKELEQRGAIIMMEKLEDIDGHKAGLDDWLVKCATEEVCLVTSHR